MSIAADPVAGSLAALPHHRVTLEYALLALPAPGVTPPGVRFTTIGSGQPTVAPPTSWTDASAAGQKSKAGGSAPGGLLAWSVSETFVADAAWVTRFDRQPCVDFFVAGPATPDADRKPAASKAAPAKAGGKAAAPPGDERSWAAWLPLDASGLLGDAGAATLTLGDEAAVAAAVAAASVAVAQQLAADLHARRSPSLAAPPGFSVLHIAVRVSAVARVDAAAAMATVVPAGGKSGAGSGTKPAAPAAKRTPAVAVGGAPAAAPSLRVLSPELRRALLPLRLVVRGAYALPRPPAGDGGGGPAAARPAYAIVRLPNLHGAPWSRTPAGRGASRDADDTLPIGRYAVGSAILELPEAAVAAAAACRVIATPGVAAPDGGPVEWRHETVVCLGFGAPAAAREWLARGAVTVEVHDRDLTEVEAAQERGGDGVDSAVGGAGEAAAAAAWPALPLARARAYAAFLSGGAPLPPVFRDAIAAAHAVNAPASPVAALPPTLSLADVDILVAGELRARLLAARERHGHAAAQFHLEGLLAPPPPPPPLAALRPHAVAPSPTGDGDADGAGPGAEGRAPHTITASLRAPLLARRQRVVPSTPIPAHALRAVVVAAARATPDYVGAGADVKLTATLLDATALHEPPGAVRVAPAAEAEPPAVASDALVAAAGSAATRGAPAHAGATGALSRTPPRTFRRAVLRLGYDDAPEALQLVLRAVAGGVSVVAAAEAGGECHGRDASALTLAGAHIVSGGTRLIVLEEAVTLARRAAVDAPTSLPLAAEQDAQQHQQTLQPQRPVLPALVASVRAALDAHTAATGGLTHNHCRAINAVLSDDDAEFPAPPLFGPPAGALQPLLRLARPATELLADAGAGLIDVARDPAARAAQATLTVIAALLSPASTSTFAAACAADAFPTASGLASLAALHGAPVRRADALGDTSLGPDAWERLAAAEAALAAHVASGAADGCGRASGGTAADAGMISYACPATTALPRRRASIATEQDNAAFTAARRAAREVRAATNFVRLNRDSAWEPSLRGAAGSVCAPSSMTQGGGAAIMSSTTSIGGGRGVRVPWHSTTAADGIPRSTPSLTCGGRWRAALPVDGEVYDGGDAGVPPVFMYSSQALNTAAADRAAALAAAVAAAGVGDALTYNPEFARLAVDDAPTGRGGPAAGLTMPPRAWQWQSSLSSAPTPSAAGGRRRGAWSVPPALRPSPARLAELSTPFVDPIDAAVALAPQRRHGGGNHDGARGRGRSRASSRPQTRGPAPFTPLPRASPLPRGVFGYVDPATHARTPAGDAAFTASLHASWADAAAAAAAAARRAAADWERRRVVANARFTPHATSPRRDSVTPGTLDARRPLLDGAPAKLGLACVAATAPLWDGGDGVGRGGGVSSPAAFFASTLRADM